MGKVYLVGAGCGGYQLITLRGKKLLEEADCVIYDRLIDPQLLNFCREDAEIIYLGKGNTEGGTLQELINKTLVEKGLQYNKVVRLKGGDSFVFGRGGEELQSLMEAGLSFEMVPGISSSLAVPEFAGIPVTHRGISRSFHVFTAHFSDPSKTLDFDTVAKLTGTLIFLMGVGNLDKIASGLMEAGKDPKTPVAIIEKGARTRQRVVSGDLSTIVEIGKKEKVTPPAIILVGEVAKLQSQFTWYEEKPLHGKRFLVTRAKGQEKELVEGIYELGGEALHVPLLGIRSRLDDQLQPDASKIADVYHQLGDYKWILFNSANGVEHFMKGIKDLRVLAGIKIGVVGTKTKEALESYKIVPDKMPEEYQSSKLLNEVAQATSSEDKILVVTSQISHLHKKDLTKEYGRPIDLLVSHNTEALPYKREELIKTLQDIDYVTFLSGSAVESYLAIMKGDFSEVEHLRYITIGPKTSVYLKEQGIKIEREAKNYSVEGILEELACLNEQED